MVRIRGAVFCELGYKAPGSTNDREFLEELGVLASERGLISELFDYKR
jgi:hypothetical protein